MQRILIIGAERDISIVEKYLQCSDEVCAVCYKPNLEIDRLNDMYDNLVEFCIQIKLDNAIDSLEYLKKSVRFYYKIDDFKRIIYLK